jgi:iron complex outermembrane recepter protein
MYREVLKAMVHLLLLASIALAQEGSGSVYGTVFDSTGAAISGATVKLSSPKASDLAASTTTDVNGIFRFHNLPEGKYRLSVTAAGFTEATQDLMIIAGGSGNIELLLNPAAISGDVVIGATRTVESIAAIPGSVTIIDREQITQQSDLSNSLTDALGKLVPGLAPGSQSSSVFGQTLRGRRPLVLIDGIPQATNRNVSRDLTTIDPAAIERIEVIRGATAIYGEGAAGGIINIITRSAATGEPLNFSTDIGFGNSLSHLADSFGGFTRQTFSGKHRRVDYLLSGSFDRTGGLFDAEGDRIPPDPHGQGGPADTNAYNLYSKLGYDFTSKQHAQISLNRFVSEQETEYASDPSVNLLPPLTQKARVIRGIRLDDPQDSRNLLIDFNYAHQNLFGSRLQTQYYHREYLTHFFPSDNRRVPNLGNVITQSRLDSKTNGGRALIETPLKRAWLTAVYGLDLNIEHTAQPVSIIDPTAFDQSGGLVFRVSGNRDWVPLLKSRNAGAFLQLEWRKFEQLTLRAGGRHERIHVNVPDFTTIAGNAVIGGNLNYHDTLFNAGAVYSLNPFISIFGNFSQGFSAPDIGLSLRGAPAGAVVGTLQFAAQKIDNYEVGMRGYWQRLQASLTVFRGNSDLGTSSAGFNQPVVRAPEKVYGVEATLDVSLMNSMRMGSTATWLEGKFDPDRDGRFTFLNSYRIPPVKATAYLEHDMLARWRNRLQVTYSGSRNRFGASANFGERRVEDYVTVDYLGSLKLGRGSLRFGIENLLNKQYFVRESQLLRLGTNSSYTAAQGATLSVGYTINY